MEWESNGELLTPTGDTQDLGVTKQYVNDTCSTFKSEK